MKRVPAHFCSVKQRALVLILIIQLINPLAFAQTPLPRVGSHNHIENMVPNQEALFGVRDEYLIDFEQNFPEPLRRELESNLKLSFNTLIEAFVLNSGLYHKFTTTEKSIGRDQLVARLQEKSDDLSLKYELPGIGKAELILLGRGKYQMPITTVRLQNGRYIVFLDTSLYDPEIFKQNIPENMPENEARLEIKMRSIMKGLIHGLVSQLLVFGKKGGPHIPLYKRANPHSQLSDIQVPLTQEIEALATRYAEIEEDLKRIETSDRNYNKLVAEREVIEETVIRLQKDKSSFWGKMVLSGAVNLTAEESKLGQPVTLVYHNQGQFLESTNLERPHEDTFRDSIHKWKTYAKGMHESIHIDWDSIYLEKGVKKLKVFLKGDLYYQYINMPWQITLAMASGYLLTFVTDNAPNWSALGLNSLFVGMFIGLNIRTFLNWSLFGTELSKSVKDTGLGIVFSLSAYLFDPVKSIADITLMTWSSMVGSQFAKNLIKKGPREYQSFQKETGQTRGEYSSSIERHILLWRKTSITQSPVEIEVFIPFKMIKEILEKNGLIRVEKLYEIPREIKKESVLSTEMLLKTYVPKTLGTFSPFLFPLYALMGPYWEQRAVAKKEEFLANYLKEHGENTPKSRDYIEMVHKARATWEGYALITPETLSKIGIDVSNSTLFKYGIQVPSQYLGYYIQIAQDTWGATQKFFTEKTVNLRIQDYMGRAIYNYEKRKQERRLKHQNRLNLNNPPKRESLEELDRRRDLVFGSFTCSGYFK